MILTEGFIAELYKNIKADAEKIAGPKEKVIVSIKDGELYLTFSGKGYTTISALKSAVKKSNDRVNANIGKLSHKYRDYLKRVEVRAASTATGKSAGSYMVICRFAFNAFKFDAVDITPAMEKCDVLLNDINKILTFGKSGDTYTMCQAGGFCFCDTGKTGNIYVLLMDDKKLPKGVSDCFFKYDYDADKVTFGKGIEKYAESIEKEITDTIYDILATISDFNLYGFVYKAGDKYKNQKSYYYRPNWLSNDYILLKDFSYQNKMEEFSKRK